MSVINTYIGGHNPWYMCIETRENAENWLKGFDLLIEYGAEFTGEDFMWIKEEYDNTEGKQIIIENIKNLLDYVDQYSFNNENIIKINLVRNF